MRVVIVGLIHIMDVAERVERIIDIYNPDVAAIELDRGRLEALRTGYTGGEDFMGLGKMQRKIAAQYGSSLGADMMSLVHACMKKGLRIALIDDNINTTIERLNGMPRREKLRLVIDLLRSRFGLSRKKFGDELQEYMKNSDEYLGIMRKKYPWLMKTLMDDREERMAERINRLLKEYDSAAVFVGDAHVSGLLKRFPNAEVIRLRDILSEKS